MKVTTAYVLRDGRIFTDLGEARRKAGALHADLLSKLSAQLVKATDGKYVATQKFIMENRAQIQEMFAAFDDIPVEHDAE